MTDDDDRSALEIAHDPPRRTPASEDTGAARTLAGMLTYALVSGLLPAGMHGLARDLHSTIFDLADKLDAARAKLEREREWSAYVREACEMWKQKAAGNG